MWAPSALSGGFLPRVFILWVTFFLSVHSYLSWQKRRARHGWRRGFAAFSTMSCLSSIDLESLNLSLSGWQGKFFIRLSGWEGGARRSCPCSAVNQDADLKLQFRLDGIDSVVQVTQKRMWWGCTCFMLFLAFIRFVTICAQLRAVCRGGGGAHLSYDRTVLKVVRKKIRLARRLRGTSERWHHLPWFPSGDFCWEQRKGRLGRNDASSLPVRC